MMPGIPSAYCTPIDTAVIAAQQVNPIKIGLPPFFTKLIRFVFILEMDMKWFLKLKREEFVHLQV